jgi:hypothetical protein
MANTVHNKHPPTSAAISAQANQVTPLEPLTGVEIAAPSAGRQRAGPRTLPDESPSRNQPALHSVQDCSSRAMQVLHVAKHALLTTLFEAAVTANDPSGNGLPANCKGSDGVRVSSVRVWRSSITPISTETTICEESKPSSHEMPLRSI